MAEKTRAQQLVGDIAPKLADLTDEVLFGDVWRRPELSPRDRSLVIQNPDPPFRHDVSALSVRPHLRPAQSERRRAEAGDDP